MKKILIGIGVLTISIGVLFVLMANGKFPLGPTGFRLITKVFGTPLEEATVPTPKNEHSRIYPETIKGLWEPDTLSLNKIVGSQDAVFELKNIGVNTIAVSLGYIVDEEGNTSVLGIEMVAKIIEMAKNAGFAVLLSTDDVPGFIYESETGPSPGQINKVALLGAEMAETYNVEYYAPQNEFNDDLDREEFEAGEVTGFASEWFEDLVPEIKKIYSGKLIAKIGRPDDKLRLPSADAIAYTIDHYNEDLDVYRERIRQEYQDMAAAAKASKTDWFVGETYLFFDSDDPEDLDGKTTDELRELQDDYHRIALEELLNFDGKPKPIGFTFMGYLMKGLEIRDTESEDVIREYFQKI